MNEQALQVESARERLRVAQFYPQDAGHSDEPAVKADNVAYIADVLSKLSGADVLAVCNVVASLDPDGYERPRVRELWRQHSDLDKAWLTLLVAEAAEVDTVPPEVQESIDWAQATVAQAQAAS
jgi:hypothetical protein